MTYRQPFEYPADKQALFKRAIRLEIATLIAMTIIVTVLYFAVGSSQAMKTAWLEDVLGLVPAIAFFVARYFERKPPDETFPFGRYKASSVAYLVAATALLGMGGYMLYDSTMALVKQEHPTIGPVTIFGWDIWFGWLMIAALLFSIGPPVILGRLKGPVGAQLHDKVLIADAAMQRADWMTAAAAIVGIIGVGFGFWWADSAAALLISADVLNDARRHMSGAIADLVDHVPTSADEKQEPLDILGKSKQIAEDEPWVASAEVMWRNEGRPLTGTVLVKASDLSQLAAKKTKLKKKLQDLDWRVYEPTITIVSQTAKKPD